MCKLNLHLTVGLPASGKSFFAKDFIKRNPEYKLIDIDSLKDENFFMKKMSLVDILNDQIRITYHRKDANIFLDALILTNEEIGNVLFQFSQFYDDIFVTIHYWKENREVCLKNDCGRRDTPSAITIKNAVLEKIDQEKILENVKSDKYNTYNVNIEKIVYHDVHLKEDWYRCFKPFVWIEKDKKLRSASWCSGGAYGNCWDSTLSVVTPDDPVDFEQLDNLLIKTCPNLNFIDYRKIRKECVSTEEHYESDYYGGGTTNVNWVCDLEKLYSLLKEMGYKLEV